MRNLQSDFKIKIQPFSEIRQEALDDYNLANGNALSYQAPKSEKNRIILNYIRHHKTNYEYILNNSTRHSKKSALEFKYFVIEQIAVTYDELYDYCQQELKFIQNKIKQYVY